MILVRDTFRVTFGKMKDAVASIKASQAMFATLGPDTHTRVLTDLTGPYYTLALEMTFPDLASWEQMIQTGFNNPDWQAWYATFVPYLEGGHREFYNVVM